MNTKYYTSDIPCIACESEEYIQFYSTSKKVLLSNKEQLAFEQNLECCNVCGLIRQENNRTYSARNLNKYYSQAFRTPVDLSKLSSRDSRIQNAKSRLRFISKLKDTGTLLEVGFGDGVFLNVAARSFQCTGLDPSNGYQYLHEYLRRKGISIIKESLENYSTRLKFDIVCSFLVLEHIKSPLTFIKEQLKHLKPNGFLVVEVPDIRNYARFNSESVLTFEHVYHYSIETLTYLLSQLNLELISSTNKNISYGFSLIAAFRLKKKLVPKMRMNGFGILNLLEKFIEGRVSYRDQMSKAIFSIYEKARANRKQIGIYGTGYLFNYAIDQCGLDIDKVDFLFDDTKEKSGVTLFGKKIESLADHNGQWPGYVLVFSEMFFEIMKQNILSVVKSQDLEIINVHQLSMATYD